MELLIKEHKLELATVDLELQEISATLLTYSTVDDFTTQDKQITDNLSKLSKQLITTKEKS